MKATEAADSKALPDLPSNDNTVPSIAENADGQFTDKALPATPGLESEPTAEMTPAAHDPRQRASMSLSPSTPFDSMTSTRFYSQTQQPGENLLSAKHTRSQSQPLMLTTPLSPIAPSESDSSGSHNSRTHPMEGKGSENLHESRSSQDEGLAADQQKTEQNNQALGLPQSTLHHELSGKSRKPVPNLPTTSTATETAPRNVSISAGSSLSTHPYRNEARTLNETAEPVELAVTKDDSSEEIVMSSTAYPGQEWTPMHI